MKKCERDFGRKGTNESHDTDCPPQRQVHATSYGAEKKKDAESRML